MRRATTAAAAIAAAAQSTEHSCPKLQLVTTRFKAGGKGFISDDEFIRRIQDAAKHGVDMVQYRDDGEGME